MNSLQVQDKKMDTFKVKITDYDLKIAQLVNQREEARKELASCQPPLLKTMKNLKRKRAEVEEDDGMK